MSHAIGIDLGGTKIEAQVFDADWQITARSRVDTPGAYDRLVGAVAEQIAWARDAAGAVPVGISAAGLVDGRGLALTANLSATGQPLPADIAAAAGPVTYVNDCRALALSEAVLGAGRGARVTLGLVLGTGVGGGVAVEGRLLPAAGGYGGEFGHMCLPAGPMLAHGLPVLRCGCGRSGCVETLVSGRGIERIAEALTGAPHSAREMAAERGRVWDVWLELLAAHLFDLAMAVDPDIIVIGGGLSGIEGLAEAASDALARGFWPGFAPPRIALAEGGATSGARGAALVAVGEGR